MNNIGSEIESTCGDAARKIKRYKPTRWVVQTLNLNDGRESMDMPIVDTPEKVHEYWINHIQNDPTVSSDTETLVVLVINTRKRVKGHYVVANGTLDSVVAHPREIFRPALIANASAIILMHNHPSGDPTPSGNDIRATRDIIKGGQLLKVELLDHVIVGHRCAAMTAAYTSLRELGYFYS